MAQPVLALICALIASVSFSSPLFAAQKAEGKDAPSTLGGFFIAPTVGGFSFSGPESRRFSLLYGGKIGYDFAGKSVIDSLGIEGSVNYFTASAGNGGSSAQGYLFRLDSVFPFVLSPKVVPFLAAGLGGLVTITDTDKAASPFFNYGGGLKLFFADYLALRTDVRHLIVYDAAKASPRNDFELTIGLSYYFGKVRKVPPSPDAELQEKSQKDKDKKQNGQKEKEQKEKELKQKEQERLEKERDEYELKEQERKKQEKLEKVRLRKEWEAFEQTRKGSAPGGEKSVEAAFLFLASNSAIPTPAAPASAPPPVLPVPTPEPLAPPAKVEATPEPARAETLPPALVSVAPVRKKAPSRVAEPEKRTEPEKRKVVRELTLEFEFDRSYIDPKYYTQLEDLADFLKSNPGSSALIEGHTDNIGRDSYNFNLSKLRAKIVKNSLVKFGIAPGRISTRGYGPTRPLADNATSEGRQRNRRAVTIVIVTN